MKTPSEVIASDNSSAVNEIKELVVNCCDEMFKEFEKAVEESCGKFDRSFYRMIDLTHLHSYNCGYKNFQSMCNTHFLNMIGEWAIFTDIEFFQEHMYNGVKINVKYDTMKNCFVEPYKYINPKS